MISRIFRYIIIFLLGIIIFISLKAYQSMNDQMILLSEFNSNNFITPINIINQMNSEIPNISVTTIPLDHMKANYYVNLNRFDEAKSLIKRGNNKNPYLGFGDLLLSRIYKKENLLDSSLIYATTAINKLPNNGAHIQNFYSVVGENYDLVDEIFNKYSNHNDPVFWLAYINHSVNNPIKSKSELLKLNQYALDNFNKQTDNFKKLEKYLKFGLIPSNYQNVMNEGLSLFNQRNFAKAVEKFLEASKLNGNDYAVFENLGIAYYMNGNYQNALENIDFVIRKFNPKNGKAEMIKGLILIALGDNLLACDFFNESIKFGNIESEKYQKQFCESR